MVGTSQRSHTVHVDLVWIDPERRGKVHAERSTLLLVSWLRCHAAYWHVALQAHLSPWAIEHNRARMRRSQNTLKHLLADAADGFVATCDTLVSSMRSPDARPLRVWRRLRHPTAGQVRHHVDIDHAGDASVQTLAFIPGRYENPHERGAPHFQHMVLGCTSMCTSVMGAR
jgi:hypothetical protein